MKFSLTSPSDSSWSFLPVYSHSLFCSHCNIPALLTLSSCESGCSKLCCCMAIGGGRGTESAPSSPSSSPQLCMPEELDLDKVPLDRPSLRTRWKRQASQWLHRTPLHRVQGTSVSTPPPLKFHPEVWLRCHPSLSENPLSSLRSFLHRGSSCACGPISSRARQPCRCLTDALGWWATSVVCYLRKNQTR